MPDSNPRVGIADFITEFQHRMDRGLAMDDLVVEDVVVSSPETEMRGRATYSAAVRGRAGKTVRHCWHNLRIELDGEHKATARYIVIALHGPGDGALALITVGDVTDRLVCADDGWKLVSSRFERVFRHEP